LPKSSVEYATDQITVYRSCPYMCKYCWAQLPLFKSRIQRGKYEPVAEAAKYVRIKGKRTIVVSFTADPYPPCEVEKKLTRRVLNILAMCPQHKIMVLTKNPALAFRDVDFVFEYGHPDFWFGTTIVSLDKTDWEPNAPNPKDRVLTLKLIGSYSASKIKTWISIEPIIPEVTNPAEIIEHTRQFVDFYVLGALNYASNFGYTKKQLKQYYLKTIPEAIRILRENDIPFLIKKELKKYLEA